MGGLSGFGFTRLIQGIKRTISSPKANLAVNGCIRLVGLLDMCGHLSERKGENGVRKSCVGLWFSVRLV